MSPLDFYAFPAKVGCVVVVLASAEILALVDNGLTLVGSLLIDSLDGLRTGIGDTINGLVHFSSSFRGYLDFFAIPAECDISPSIVADGLAVIDPNRFGNFPESLAVIIHQVNPIDAPIGTIG